MPHSVKKPELTGRISLRQLLLLWQSPDDLARLYALTQVEPSATTERMPATIDEVL